MDGICRLMNNKNRKSPMKDILQLGDSIKGYSVKPAINLHTLYLTGEIESPDEYTDVFENIRMASPNDVIKIHINSPGGDLFTAIQFMRVLKETEAKVVTSVEGACMSAATLIFLAADQFEISEHSVFMFHNYSTFMYGKGGELFDGIMHDRKWSENLLKTEYEGFLTDKEIETVLDGKDIWLDADEAVERLNTFAKLQAERIKAQEAEAQQPATKKRKSTKKSN
jgi:ATP-dependent protease ClpP protease subunit